VVAGIRNTLSLDDLATLDPKSHDQLMKVMRRLETHYRDLCDIEFTIERGKLWMLQTWSASDRRGGVPDRRPSWSTRA
jgi:pyruvate,orthophosphate dikinase